jgi:ABC-type transporter Mla MlaB component
MTQAVDPELLTVSRNGDATIIGFQSDRFHDDVCLAAYRERVLQLADEPTCKRFQFDLSNIKILPSGMLGLLASLKKRGFAVDLLNPSDDVLEVLQVMKMDSVFGIRQTP